jgi:hypothetical protein
MAAKELDQADIELGEALDELKELDVYCLDPALGLALIPFGKGDDLAWYVFDLYAPRGIEAWRFQRDALETRRPLQQNADSMLATKSD